MLTYAASIAPAGLQLFLPSVIVATLLGVSPVASGYETNPPEADASKHKSYRSVPAQNFRQLHPQLALLVFH